MRTLDAICDYLLFHVSKSQTENVHATSKMGSQPIVADALITLQGMGR